MTAVDLNTCNAGWKDGWGLGRGAAPPAVCLLASLAAAGPLAGQGAISLPDLIKLLCKPVAAMLKAALAGASKGGQGAAPQAQEQKIDTASFPCIDEGAALDVTADFESLRLGATPVGSMPARTLSGSYKGSVSSRVCRSRWRACRPPGAEQPYPSRRLPPAGALP